MSFTLTSVALAGPPASCACPFDDCTKHATWVRRTAAGYWMAHGVQPTGSYWYMPEGAHMWEVFDE